MFSHGISIVTTFRVIYVKLLIICFKGQVLGGRYVEARIIV